MTFVILFVTTSIIFLVADALMLRTVLQPVFARHLGDILYEGGFRLLPAVLFYLTYMGGMLWFASWPALRDGAPAMALLNGAILGLVAYGTYEFTNLATLKGWTWRMVATDLTWGTMLTGFSAIAGVWVARMVAPA